MDPAARDCQFFIEYPIAFLNIEVFIATKARFVKFYTSATISSPLVLIIYMGVSKNTTKWMDLYWKSLFFIGWFGGKPTIFGNTHISKAGLKKTGHKYSTWFKFMTWLAWNLLPWLETPNQWHTPFWKPDLFLGLRYCKDQGFRVEAFCWWFCWIYLCSILLYMYVYII